LTKKIPKVFISCGEYSGEAHACRVVEELQAHHPEIQIYAFGSKALEERGVKVLFDYKNYSFSGLTEVVKNLSAILKLKQRISDSILELDPDLVLLVDYSGFNLELARALKLSGFKKPIYEYIAPQLWASRPWRIKKIKKNIDKVLCTLPFEQALYQQAQVPYRYVGNPVAISLQAPAQKQDFANFDEILVGLFPGSRKSEIQYMLPIMLRSARSLTLRHPDKRFKFIIAKAQNLSEDIFYKYGYKQDSGIQMIDGSKSNNHKLLSGADLLWLCSGTVTLEAALYGTPHFLAYKSNFINYICYLFFRTTTKAGLANIINQKDLVKEFLQYSATEQNFIRETENFLSNNPGEIFSTYYHQQKSLLNEFRRSLTGLETAKLVAEEIINACT
jgi:lipid-A-disaccharide synthase